MAFADADLSTGGPRGDGANPGSGGWPTIRYFNKETGTKGAAYVKKIDSAPMCEELGPKHGLLNDYIMEASGTSLCSVVEPYSGCSEKEIKYIKKMAKMAIKGEEDLEAQSRRLTEMSEKKMKPALKKWMSQRLAILKSLLKEGGHDKAEL